MFKKESLSNQQLTEAALSFVLTDELEKLHKAAAKQDEHNPFVVESGFRINYDYCQDIKLKHNETEIVVKVKHVNRNSYQVSTDGGKSWNAIEGYLETKGNKLVLKCHIDDNISTSNVFRNQETLVLFNQVKDFNLHIFHFLNL